MNDLGYIFGLICILISVGIVVFGKIRVHTTITQIEAMLDEAIEGNLSETTFDESRLSALETKLSHYLSASELSAKNVALEKERIKTLIADISHQTKTPIANLLLYSELLKEEELSKAATANVETIYQQAEKLHFLIDALVKMSRLENGIIALSPKENELQFMLESIVLQYRAQAEEKGLWLKTKEISGKAYFDYKWTMEAIGNLVDNAIKYTESGGITISAITYEMFVRIDIRDTGMGILEENQASIFQRFYRTQENASKEGVGLGLYLAREIVSSQGGYIKVQSKVGEGSVFSVFLSRQGEKSR